ncbi:MAG: DUF3488 and transglutaminase-like domain-containing protein [Pseudomonadales bacterium]|nr:DUF3488 and transglutaminase-like domain-containing protein [Pseudomonadales bacterium]
MSRKTGKQENHPIPRNALVWILLALSSVILPHMARIPAWLVLLFALCVLGRILIFQGRLSYPGTTLKTLFVMLTFGAVLVPFGRDIFSSEGTICILIAGITLKLLEMRYRRDFLVVIYLCYFTVIAEFIYSQSIPMSIYMAFSVVLITAALMSLTQTQEYQRPLRTLKLSALILLQSVPIMIALFLLFPRISPLWSVPLQSRSAVTGLSEKMSPGDIGNLARSAEIVFRVKFDEQIPANADLYWRGLTLDRFDGRAWTRREGLLAERQYLGSQAHDTKPWFNDIEYQSEIVDYNVILEPTGQNWIFSLKIPRIRQEGLMMRNDFQLENIRNINQRFSYDARSYLRNRIDLKPAASILQRALQLPLEGNERSLSYARELRAQTQGEGQFIDLVLKNFREENFFYTLTPTILGDDSVDEFLFETREGFCEHYAGSFVFLMRAAGIPARVVTGYQGGEYNPYDETLIVRQYDAHAWAEVWLDGAGWIRVDPTAAVSPQRINLGSEPTLQNDQNFLGDAGFSMLRFRNNRVLNALRLRLESVDYAWNRWVLNYNRNLQLEFFNRLFDNVTTQKILLTMIGIMALSVLMVAIFVLRKNVRREMDPATRIYLRYCDLLSRQGSPRHIGESPQNYCWRIAAVHPLWAADMVAITTAYLDIAFRYEAGNPEIDARLGQLRERVRRFRLAKLRPGLRTGIFEENI